MKIMACEKIDAAVVTQGQGRLVQDSRKQVARLSAAASTRRVFPDPVGPRNRKFPIGHLVSVASSCMFVQPIALPLSSLNAIGLI